MSTVYKIRWTFDMFLDYAPMPKGSMRIVSRSIFYLNTGRKMNKFLPNASAIKTAKRL